MKTKFDLLLKTLFIAAFATVMNVFPANAQIDEKYKDYREVWRDTTVVAPTTSTSVLRDTVIDPYRVMTNSFEKNWFVYGTAGGHTFRGDYSSDGPFKGTLSPDFSIGIGKWVMPWVGLKLELTGSNSRGYTEYDTYHYGYGEMISNPNGPDYRKMKTGWFDLAGLVTLNLTRMFHGYEGYNSKARMNQMMLNAGLGGVHHMGYEHSYGSDNEWSGHLELQYSRFFSPKKRASLDIKARALVYQTNFDLEYGQYNKAANKFDSNLGLDVGFTFYLGKARNGGWSSGTQTIYRQEYREREIQVMKVKEVETETLGAVKTGTMTFFVFYPNNYSGRNDAPLVPSSSVNALDYLAGGIFTQKQYSNPVSVTEKFAQGASLNGLPTIDLPTEPANKDFTIDFVPRGYEMLKDTPMSLSLNPDDMTSFRNKAGFYYAPIYDGLHVWNYRIDDATLKQQLISNQNYLETNSFGLNAHSGLETVSTYMDVEKSDRLVSFADVYAALNGNTGYISQFADEETVDYVQDVFNRGAIMLIQVEGLATSQDNYTGQDSRKVGIERNTALAENRANTVISWLKGYDPMQEVQSQIFLLNNAGGIRTVTDSSTRGLNAKLNRCVKVRIHYMIK